MRLHFNLWKHALFAALMAVVFVASGVSADYKFNPHTQKLDRTNDYEAVTHPTTTITGGFFQTGLTDCDLDNQGLNYDSGLGKFICGDDDSGGAGSFDGFLSTPLYVITGSNVSTLRADGLYVATSTSNLSGLFSVDASGNVSVSGTLRAYGRATFTNVSSTYVSSTVMTVGNLTVLSGLSFPNDSITDAMVADNITVSNYLLLTGGTLSGTLNGTRVSSTYASSTYASSTQLTTGALTVFTALSLPADSVTDVMVVPGLTISGGTINNTTIGATTPSTAIFTIASSTYVSSTVFSVAGGFFQNGLTDCDADNQAVAYDSPTGLFTCGDDDNSGSTFTGFLTTPLYVTNGSTTSTLRSDGLYITTSSANLLGLFSVDGSGNTSVSGTLKVFGGTTLGNLTATNIFGTNVSSTYASSTYASTTAFSTNGYFQGGLGDCELDTDGLNYDLQTGKFLCGDDDAGAGSAFTGALYFGNVFSTTDGNSTSTLRDDSLYINTSTANILGIFNVDASGNVSASGTLQTFGLSTFLTGFISNASSSIGGNLTVSGLSKFVGAINASSTLLLGGLTNATVSTTLLSNAGIFIGQNSTTFRSGFFSVETSPGFNGNVSTSGTLRIAGLSTFVSGFISNASSSIGAGLQVAGALNASSSLLIGGTTQQGVSTTFMNNGGLQVGRNNTTFRLGAFYVDTTVGGNGNVFTSGTIRAVGLGTYLAGIISNASSSIGAGLQVAGHLSASGTLSVAGGFFQTGLVDCSGNSTTLRYNSTTGKMTCSPLPPLVWHKATYGIYTGAVVDMGLMTNTSTITMCRAVGRCEGTCQSAWGMTLQVRHGLNPSATNTMQSLFTTDININSSSTVKTFCASGCTNTMTFGNQVASTSAALILFAKDVSSTPTLTASLQCEGFMN